MRLDLCIFLLILYNFKICACENGLWHLYGKYSDRNREELVVTSIKTADEFKLEFNVSQWRSISVDSKTVSIGIMQNSLVMVQFKDDQANGFKMEPNIIDLDYEVDDVRLFQSLEDGKSEIIMIVSCKNQSMLNWYEVKDTNIVQIWDWFLVNKIHYFDIIQIKNQNKILLLNNKSLAEIYDFSIKDQYYWILEAINLEYPSKNAAFVQYKWDYFLSVTQKDSVSVFKFENNHFVPYKNISCAAVHQVVAFEIGFKSFIAVGGLKPAIYQITDNDLKKETIANSHTDNVRFWVVLPVKEYRDDTVLLVQRGLHHGTHNSTIIDLITYNGENFLEHDDIPCLYFGDERSSLTCLIDDETKNNIKQIAHITVDDKLSLLVPNENGQNTLFSINFDLVKLGNPILTEMDELVEEKEKVQNLLNSYEKKNVEQNLVSSAQTRTSKSNADQEEAVQLLRQDDESDFKQLKEDIKHLGDEITELEETMEQILSTESQTKFDTIIIEGPVEIKRGQFERATAKAISGEPVTELLRNIVRKDQLNDIPSLKTFSEASITNLNTDSINGVFSADLTYKTDSSIELSGDVLFANQFSAVNVDIRSGFVNGEKLEDMIVLMNRKINDTLHFREIVVKDTVEADEVNNLKLTHDNLDTLDNKNNIVISDSTVFIPENVTVKNINGENMNDFLRQICLKNLKCYIPGDVKMNGNIIVKGNAYTEFLNDLHFPSEYVLVDEIPHINMTGKKTFEHLEVIELRTIGNINNASTNNFISLWTPQSIPGKIEFDNLEVTEEVNIKGDIVGKHLDKFLSNPTLSTNVTNVKARVNFKSLQVEGSVIVSNNFNNKNYKELLEDIVYKDEDDVHITGVKEFLEGITVRNNLQVDSNIINNIHIEDIVTKDTDQILNINTLNGTVSFKNLFLEGLYGAKNISKIDQESVKLTGEQYISSTLIFNNDIKVKNLEVTGKINDFHADEYLYTTGDRVVENPFELGEVKIENLIVEKDILGEKSNLDLRHLQENALSYTKDQTISGNYTFASVSADEIQISNINDKQYLDLFDDRKITETIFERVRNLDMKIENLHVNGSLTVSEINERNMSSMLMDQNDFPKNVEFEDNVYFNHVEIGSLSGVNFKEFMEDVVFKNETSLKINGEIRFTNVNNVKKLIETKKINDIDINNILTKYGKQTIQNAVVVDGDVYFEDVSISDSINGMDVENFNEKITIEDDTVTVKGDLFFERQPQIMNLTIMGFVEDLRIEEILKNIVYINETIKLSKETVFEKPVDIQGNLRVFDKYNGINISEEIPNIVLLTKDDVVDGPVYFSESVYFLKYLQVENDLKSATLFGIDLEDWKRNAIFVNKGLLLGKYIFQDVVVKDNILTEFVNNIDMNTIIPLRSDQTLPHMSFFRLTMIKDVQVRGLIGGYNIREEIKNTLTATGDHEINSEIVFQNNVLVRDSLITPRINDVDVEKIVTTNTDQNLTATYNYQMKCSMHGNIILQGNLNGINITSWSEDVVREKAGYVQEVKEQWHVSGNMTLEDDAMGDALINGLNLQEMQRELERKIRQKYSVEQAIIDDYNNLCKDVEQFYELSKQQIYKFRYFEDLQVMEFSKPVGYVKPFQHKTNNYLLVNEENSCDSHMMVFYHTSFFPASSSETGQILQAIAVYDQDQLYFVTRGSKKSNCEVTGTNLWKFADEKLELLLAMDNQKLLQESLIPGTFYGLNKYGVTEYQIKRDILKPYRLWEIFEDNMSFVPRGLATGLAIRTGTKLIMLSREELEDSDDIDNEFGVDFEVVIQGNRTVQDNPYMPGRFGGDLATTTVGTKESKRTLLAVASHEEISVKEPLDFITIYSDAIFGKIFHRIATYKPSSLVSVEFNNGETLLVFMENKRTLQVYEYKGINGFRHRFSAKLTASHLFLMTLPVGNHLNERKVIGAVNGNKITLLQSIMSGNQIQGDLQCRLQ